jgi:predicted RecA/RadA family phage recombinase
MKREKLALAWAVSAALVFAGLALAGAAWGSGRDFSGSYQVSDVSVSGDTASLTLSLRLFNHSTADVSNATVVLRDLIIPSRNFGTFPNVNIPAGQTVQLSGTFQVPQREYQSWQQGRKPFLMIEYADASGNKVRRPIEVAPGHVRPGIPPEAEPETRPEARVN